MRKTSHSTARPGFTLVELMVVIGIITLLAAVLVVAIGRAGVKAREDATASLIKKVSGQVQERLEALDRLKSQPQFAQEASIFAGQNNLSTNQAKILLLKDAMKKYFPQSFAEFETANPTEFNRFIDPQNLITTSPKLAPWLTSHPKHVAETESSAVLYYMLTQGSVLGIPTMTPGDFKSTEAADTDGDGLQEFIDAWGKPLRFYRWPTRLFATGAYDSNTPPLPVIDRTRGATVLFRGLPANDADLKKDQDDPTFLLYDTNTTSYVAMNYTEAKYHTPRTYHNFLIVSSGPDGQRAGSPNHAFGLLSPTSTSDFGYLAQPMSGQFDAMTDNITNRNR